MRVNYLFFLSPL